MTKTPTLSRLQRLILLSLVAMSAISTDLYLSGLPQMVEDFSSTTSQVQLTLSLFLLGLAIGQMVAGPLSDQYGRIPILKIGLGLYVIVSLACVFAPTIESLWGLRFVQGLAASCGPVLSRAIVSDLYVRKDAARILAYLSSAMALIPALAPIVGSIMLLWFEWPIHFVLLAVFGLVLWLLVNFQLPETQKNQTSEQTVIKRLGFVFSNLGRLFGDRVYVGYVICGSIAHGCMFAYISSSSYLVTGLLQVPPQYFGYTFAVNVCGYILGAYISGKIVHRVAILKLLGVGLALLFSVIVVLLTQFQYLQLSVLLFAMFLVFAAGGFILANAQAAAITRFKKAAGAASAVFGFIQITTAASAGFFAGYFYNDTVIPMTIIIAICSLMGVFSWYFLLYRLGEWDSNYG